MTDRAQEQVGKAAVAARADHEKVSAPGRLDQGLRGRALDDTALDREVRVLDVAKGGVDRLLGRSLK